MIDTLKDKPVKLLNIFIYTLEFICQPDLLICLYQQCSADCGKGKQRRDVVCLNTAESPNGCPSESQPNSTRPCSRTSCGVTYEWFTGKWGAVSFIY